MFGFRIIICADGSEIIDMSVKTPHEALTPVQMMEYVEMDAQIAYMERLKREKRREAEQQRKISRNLLYKVACLCRLV